MRHRALLLTLPLAACLGEKPPEDPTDTANDSAAPPPAIGWYADVEPLVAKSCASCHDGAGVGGIDLTDPDVATAWADAMAVATASGIMPPPALDPDCQRYNGTERMVLTDEERAIFADWASDGAPLGRPEDAPTPVSWGTRITEPDLTLTMPFEHEVTPEADGNQYFCVVLDNPLTEPAAITGIDVSLGDATVVHHMLLARDWGKDAGADYGADDPSAGFDCRDPIMEDDWELLHAWAPGMDATRFPEGVGIPIQPGDQIVLQMHYFGTPGAGRADQSSYLFELAAEVEQEISMAALGPDGFTIPAGEPAHTESSTESFGLSRLTVYGVFPHMHLLGAAYEGVLTAADGTETCMASGEWDFDHQGLYIYDEPVAWTPRSSFTGTCTWDNSAANPDQYNDPPEDVRWGSGTNQEMCYFLFYFSN